MKSYTKFICQQCGYESAQWMGKCPSCGTWNSLVETLVPGQGSKTPLPFAGQKFGGQGIKLQTLAEIEKISDKRISTKIGEFDRVLGGGIVSGSVTLLAGDPGIGKSTLLLQAAANLPNVVYISGEESPAQIKIRAERLGVKNKGLKFLNETNVEAIISVLDGWVMNSGSGSEEASGEKKKKLTPATYPRPLITQNPSSPIVIIDSIQTLYTPDLTGTAGSVGQVRECTLRLLNLAKSKGISIFLVGHVTKEGAVAGPMVLAHLVDTVLFFEGEKYQSLRLLRAIKNRFGPTDEVGVFEMGEAGLAEVDNPSRIFLEARAEKIPGSVVTCLLEGTRPLFVEIQALVVPTQLAIPRRVGQGVDWNRLQLLVAVLSRIVKLNLSSYDIFVNVAGGIKIAEPSADLAISLAIASSYLDKVLDPKICALGEIGLLGEIRSISAMDKRAKEGRRLGFTKIVSPKEFSSLKNAIFSLMKK